MGRGIRLQLAVEMFPAKR